LTFDLNLLRVLDALLREQSTVKAGERLRLSQPAVSAALSRLRQALNDPLFVRQGRRLVPTGYAKSIEIPLRLKLDDLFDLLAGPKEFDSLAAAVSFKVAGSDFFAEMLMPPLASMLNRLAPGICVQLVDLLPDKQMLMLENHEIDLVLFPQKTVPDWMDWTPVFRSAFVVIARLGHPRLQEAGLVPGDTIPIDLFCDLGHVVFSPEGKLKAMGDAALARIGRERRVVMTMPVFGAICNTVADSDLVALLPEKLALKLAEKLSLGVYAAPVSMEPAQICMYWHKRNTSHPAHRWLRDMVMQALSPLDNHSKN
jgi:DNA-binding transcriptional LysR family regulator